MVLVMPAVTTSRQKETNQQTAQFSDQIAEQDAQISALQKELEEYRSTSKESENAKATAESTQESYEAVISVYQHFNAHDMSDNAMLEEMLKINPDSLGTQGRDRYEEIRDSLYPRMCEKLYNTSQQNFQVANYKSAISNLEQVMEMDEGYQDGQAMLLLAQSYEKNGDQDKANLRTSRSWRIIRILRRRKMPRKRWTPRRPRRLTERMSRTQKTVPRERRKNKDQNKIQKRRIRGKDHVSLFLLP